MRLWVDPAQDPTSNQNGLNFEQKEQLRIFWIGGLVVDIVARDPLRWDEGNSNLDALPSADTLILKRSPNTFAGTKR